MNSRFLTREEAAFVRDAAEHWLRLREVEFNAGEGTGPAENARHRRRRAPEPKAASLQDFSACDSSAEVHA